MWIWGDESLLYKTEIFIFKKEKDDIDYDAVLKLIMSSDRLECKGQAMWTVNRLRFLTYHTHNGRMFLQVLLYWKTPYHYKLSCFPQPI